MYSSFITRGPTPFLRPFPPPRSQPRPPSSLTQKSLEGGVPSRSRLRPALCGVRVSSRRELPMFRVHIRKGGWQKKGGKTPRTSVGLSSPRATLRAFPRWKGSENAGVWPVEKNNEQYARVSRPFSFSPRLRWTCESSLPGGET